MKAMTPEERRMLKARPRFYKPAYLALFKCDREKRAAWTTCGRQNLRCHFAELYASAMGRVMFHQTAEEICSDVGVAVRDEYYGLEALKYAVMLDDFDIEACAWRMLKVYFAARRNVGAWGDMPAREVWKEMARQFREDARSPYCDEWTRIYWEAVKTAQYWN